jgi:uncharacterized protein YjbI with pentapeptide repeats
MNSEELYNILEDHKLFITSQGNQGERANLRKAYLHGTMLSGVNLVRADLSEASLTKTDLSKADITGANLQSANLTNSNLCGAILIEAALPGASLKKANMQHANFSRADLTHCDLSWSNLSGANLEEAILKDADLIKATLSGSNLKGADLSGANFSGADLSEADLTGAILRNTELTDSKLDKTIFAFVRIDKNTKRKLPTHIISNFQQSFNVFGSFTDKLIIKSIEFPPEYNQACISLLSYFGKVLRDKHPKSNARISITQDKLKVTMIIETEEGEIETIEKTLSEFGAVISEEMPVHEFLPDPIQKLELENKLELAKMELKLTKEILKISQTSSEHKLSSLERHVLSLEDQTRWFRKNLGYVLAMSFKNISEFIEALKENNSSIKSELSLLSEKLAVLQPDNEDIKIVRELLISIKKKEPDTYQNIVHTLKDFGIGVAGSIWASVITEITKVFP